MSVGSPPRSCASRSLTYRFRSCAPSCHQTGLLLPSKAGLVFVSVAALLEVLSEFLDFYFSDSSCCVISNRLFGHLERNRLDRLVVDRVDQELTWERSHLGDLDLEHLRLLPIQELIEHELCAVVTEYARQIDCRSGRRDVSGNSKEARRVCVKDRPGRQFGGSTRNEQDGPQQEQSNRPYDCLSAGPFLVVSAAEHHGLAINRSRVYSSNRDLSFHATHVPALDLIDLAGRRRTCLDERHATSVDIAPDATTHDLSDFRLAALAGDALVERQKHLATCRQVSGDRRTLCDRRKNKAVDGHANSEPSVCGLHTTPNSAVERRTFGRIGPHAVTEGPPTSR